MCMCCFLVCTSLCMVLSLGLKASMVYSSVLQTFGCLDDLRRMQTLLRLPSDDVHWWHQPNHFADYMCTWMCLSAVAERGKNTSSCSQPKCGAILIFSISFTRNDRAPCLVFVFCWGFPNCSLAILMYGTYILDWIYICKGSRNGWWSTPPESREFVLLQDCFISLQILGIIILPSHRAAHSVLNGSARTQNGHGSSKSVANYVQTETSVTIYSDLHVPSPRSYPISSSRNPNSWKCKQMYLCCPCLIFSL